MERLVASLIVVLLTAIVYSAVSLARQRRQRRRHEALPFGPADIPVRLHGLTVAYPGFWRPGLLDATTGTWRPRGRWGIPVSLAGSRVLRSERVSRDSGLPPFAAAETILICVDRQGVAFRLAAFDSTDARQLQDCLVSLAAAAEPAVTASRPRLRWMRSRVPLAALLLVLAMLCWLGYFLVPLLGAQQVDGIVVRNRGGSYLCEVAWSGGHGYTDCGDLPPESRVPVTAMGWPRTGTVDDPANVAAGTLPVSAACLLLAGIFVAGPAWQRRRLARDAGRFGAGRP
jgi:hypothetical protein